MVSLTVLLKLFILFKPHIVTIGQVNNSRSEECIYLDPESLSVECVELNSTTF